MDIKNKVEK